MSVTDWRVTYRGRTTCACVRAWLPVYEQMLHHWGITSGLDSTGRLIIFQLTGLAPASAGVHAEGGAIDLAMLDPLGIRLAREMGASASWRRLWPGNLHSHLVLDGCPHNGPARYQIAAVKLGRDGTGFLGLKGTDTEWRPESWRTWHAGLVWARAQLGAAARPPVTTISTTHPDWSDMATKDEITAAAQDGARAGFKLALLDLITADKGSPTDRQARNALWTLILQGTGRFFNELRRRSERGRLLERQWSDAFRAEVADGVVLERQRRAADKEK